MFESTAHGYDTADYYTIDRRLGDAAQLAGASEALHRRGMRLLLDAVFRATLSVPPHWGRILRWS